MTLMALLQNTGATKASEKCNAASASASASAVVFKVDEQETQIEQVTTPSVYFPSLSSCVLSLNFLLQGG